jgi:hypothetical protein
VVHMIKARGSSSLCGVHHHICTSYGSNAQGRLSSFALFFNRQKFLESLIDPAEPSPAPTPTPSVTWVAELKDAFLPVLSTWLADTREDRAIDRAAEDRRHKENIEAKDRRHNTIIEGDDRRHKAIIEAKDSRHIENLAIREVDREAEDRRHNENVAVQRSVVMNQRSVVMNQRLFNVLATAIFLAVGYCAFQVFLIWQAEVAAQTVARARRLTGICKAFSLSGAVQLIGGLPTRGVLALCKETIRTIGSALRHR